MFGYKGFFKDGIWNTENNPLYEDALILETCFGIDKISAVTLLSNIFKMYRHSITNPDIEEVWDHDYFIENLTAMNDFFNKQGDFEDIENGFFHEISRLRYHAGSWVGTPPNNPLIWNMTFFPNLPGLANFEKQTYQEFRAREKLFILNFFEIDFLNISANEKALAASISLLYFDVKTDLIDDYSETFLATPYLFEQDNFKAVMDTDTITGPMTNWIKDMMDTFRKILKKEFRINQKMFLILTTGPYKVFLKNTNGKMKNHKIPRTSYEAFEEMTKIAKNKYVNSYDLALNFQEWKDKDIAEIWKDMEPWNEPYPYPNEIDFFDELMKIKTDSLVSGSDLLKDFRKEKFKFRQKVEKFTKMYGSLRDSLIKKANEYFAADYCDIHLNETKDFYIGMRQFNLMSRFKTLDRLDNLRETNKKENMMQDLAIAENEGIDSEKEELDYIYSYMRLKPNNKYTQYSSFAEIDRRWMINEIFFFMKLYFELFINQRDNRELGGVLMLTKTITVINNLLEKIVKLEKYNTEIIDKDFETMPTLNLEQILENRYDPFLNEDYLIGNFTVEFEVFRELVQVAENQNGMSKQNMSDKILNLFL